MKNISSYTNQVVFQTFAISSGSIENSCSKREKSCQNNLTGRVDIAGFYSINPYIFGFNGKEKDDEIHNSAGTSYDYGFRIYDPRLGRFLSVDPLAREFSFLSPYHFAGNSPIKAIDLDGEEIKNAYYNYDKDGKKVSLINPNDKVVADEIDEQIAAFQQDDQALYNYVNSNYTVNISDTRIKDVTGSKETYGSERTSVRTNTTTTTTTYTATQYYDKLHGEGSFKELLKTCPDEAQSFYNDYQQHKQTATTTIAKNSFTSDISLDINKMNNINDKASFSETSIINIQPKGRILKHEIGHFLYSIFNFNSATGKLPSSEEQRKQSEKKANDLENTFDGDPKTNSNPSDLEQEFKH